MYNSQDNYTIYNSTQTYDNVQNQDNVQLSRQLDMCAIYNSTQADYNVQSMHKSQDNCTRHRHTIMSRIKTMYISQDKLYYLQLNTAICIYDNVQLSRQLVNSQLDKDIQ